MIDLLLPATDRGAIGQAVGAAVIFAVLLVLARRDRDVQVLIVGLAAVTFAWFGLRTLH